MGGGSLYNMLHTDHFIFNLKQILQIATCIANALKVLHEQNPPILHRDVTSHNILLQEVPATNSDCIAKLCDFGMILTS